MKWHDHSKLSGLHAFCGASDYHWINYDNEKLISRYHGDIAKRIGTAIHDSAKTLIDGRIKITEDDRNLIRYILESKGFPRNIDVEPMLLNLIPYVNDAIGFRMETERLLYFSDYFFGTADTIAFNERTKKLRIHDLKTGAIPAHIEQLLIYMALFCLEYKYKPAEIKAELRIYQNGEILYFEPTVEDVLPVMDKIVTFNKILEDLKSEEK